MTVPPRLQDLLRRCLTKDYKARLQAIGDARVVLQEYVANPSSFIEAPRAPAAATAPQRTARLPWAIAAVAAAVAIGVAVWAFLPRARQPVRPSRLRVEAGPQPFFQGGSGSSVVVSPDGLRLAMVLGAGEDRSLYLRELNQLTQTILPGTEVAYNPFFSPDGQWIGFVTPTELKKVSISGGSPLTLAKVSRSRGASWGDNDLIVFTESPSSGLFKMPATGGQPQPLTTIDAGKSEVSHRWPQILPGGRAVLFTVLGNDRGVRNARAGGHRDRVRAGSSITAGSTAAIFSSGHLVYVNEGTLFAAPFDLDSGEFTRTPAPVVQGILSARRRALQRIGRRDAGVSRRPGRHADLRAGALRPPRQRGAVHRRAPDLRRAALLPGRPPPGGRDHRRQRRATAGCSTSSAGPPPASPSVKVPTQAPQWSPDGAWIVWGSEQEDGVNLYRRSSDGSGEEERLTTGGEGKFASSWSPDGRFILFTQVNSADRQRHHGASARRRSRAAALSPDARPPRPRRAFSPDGRWVAYQSAESGARPGLRATVPDARRQVADLGRRR